MTAAASLPQLRRATAADSEACFRLFWESISDLAARHGNPWEGTADDRWPDFTALYALLAEIAAEWWVAEDRTGEQVIGYARSIERGGLFELSEFFVRPGHQSAGVGRALLERAFPLGRGEVRAIVATGDVRAMARYLQADTSIQFPILGLTGSPSANDADEAAAARLEAERISELDDLDDVTAIERAVVGYDRGSHELAWLLGRREAYRYRDAGRAVAFAFIGPDGCGPIASLDRSHLPEVLRHVETRASVIGVEEIGFEVPAPNVVAIRHLLGRGFRLDPFVTYLMASRPFGQFDRYLGFTPPFVL